MITMHLPPGWSRLELTLRTPQGEHVVTAYDDGTVLSVFFPRDRSCGERAIDHASIDDAVALCEQRARVPPAIATCGPVNVDADGRSVE